jgi:hypothetical protein
MAETEFTEFTIPVAEWLAQACALFGADPKDWKFECPVGGNIQTLQDFKDAGAEPQRAYQECLGRVIPNPARNFASTPGGNGKNQPCDYAAFGLFQLSKAPKVIPEGGGRPVAVFPFATQAPAKNSAPPEPSSVMPCNEGTQTHRGLQKPEA